MKLKPDQQRLQELLKDTITLLCKNGLQYKDELSVEALIGVTLDQEKVFLVNIKETVQLPQTKSKNGENEKDEAGSDTEETGPVLATPRSARKRSHGGQDTTDASAAKQQKLRTPLSSSGSDHRLPVKVEKEEDEADDLVFIKQELQQNSFSMAAGQSAPLPMIGTVASFHPSFSGSSGPPHQQTVTSSIHQQIGSLDGSSQSPAATQQSPGNWRDIIQKTAGNPQVGTF